jgi:cytochrome c-type protein NapC
VPRDGDNVYEELTRTVHFSNRSGVRASCPDCHVPHEWTDKIARKMQASKEVWGKIFGTINTRREVPRPAAGAGPARMGAAEGERQPGMPQLPFVGGDGPIQADPRAAEIHTRYLLSGEATCIDCHKGIAHELPNMEGVDPGWKVPPELEGEEPGRRGPSRCVADGGDTVGVEPALRDGVCAIAAFGREPPGNMRVR